MKVSPKKTIASVVIAGVLAVGGITYSKTHNNKITIPNGYKQTSSLLTYSDKELSSAKSELKTLIIRTYSDISWSGRVKEFGKWKNNT